MIKKPLLVLALGCLLLAACASAPDEKADRLQHDVYSVTGLVQEIKGEGLVAIIHHDPIPGYMEAMTMPFTANTTNVFAGLNKDEQITFELHVTEDDSYVENVSKTGKIIRDGLANRRDFRLVRDVEPLSVGDLMPNYGFTNQFGKGVELNDYRGKVVAMTFIFTRCPLPDFCPRMTGHFSRIQEQLKKDPVLEKDWHLLTLSFDPDFDTPASLRLYGERNGYDPEKWTLMTGALVDIDAITEQFGMIFFRDAGTINFNHNLRTVVLDPDGRIRTILIGDAWETKELMDAMKEASQP